ncbi:hypothetical protein QBC35DRAFT_221740 [Podospora australis]|uniref:Ankyrin repeat protein n=1 Tax=Podospora australis TaxID=1536484 RepID=A0AAN6X1Y5_9PEZI|nr:hypothetical protein QBC35DRAFT_221740 [Podospora australis]
MHVKPQEAHHISVLAGQGEIKRLKSAVQELAARENVSTADLLISCKDDFQQTAAHIAAKSGQSKSIEALAELLDTPDKRSAYFNMANRFSGDRPVHTAMRHGYLDAFKALVENGADPTVKNRFGDRVVDYPADHYEQDEVHKVVDEYKDKLDLMTA